MKIIEKNYCQFKMCLYLHVTASKPTAAWKLASVNIVCPPQYDFQVCFLVLLHQAPQHLELTVISTCYYVVKEDSHVKHNSFLQKTKAIPYSETVAVPEIVKNPQSQFPENSGRQCCQKTFQIRHAKTTILEGEVP